MIISWMSQTHRWIRSLPLALLRNVVILFVLGIFFIYSASFRTSEDFVTRQLEWILVGSVCFVLTLRLGYRFFLGISYALYLLGIAVLVWVLLAGAFHLGAQRWIQLGPISFQPSEFAKLATALALANFLGSQNPWEGEGKALCVSALLVVIPLFLIVKQPDLGSAMLLAPLGVMVLLIWGIRYRYLLGTFLAGLTVSPVAWAFLKGYQRKRILTFLNPFLDPLGSGYTAIQSKIAVGSGGLFGKGWLHGTQSQLDFIPEHHTDFIFSVVAEELGFVGSVFILVLYGTFFYQIFQLIERTTDIKAKLLATGILSLLFFQMLVNMGMTFGLFPITGITLPFISYGGSSLVSLSIALGLLASIHKERSIF